VDWETMPPVSEPEVRLKEYRRRKAAQEELWEVNRIKFKKSLGEPLTQVEQNILAYSPFGTAAGCHHPRPGPRPRESE